MTIKELEDKYLGGKVSEPGYRHECVGWCKVARKELYNISLGSFGGSAIAGRNNVTGIFNNYKRITDGIPKEGDMIFFNTFQPYGHVAIVVDASTEYIAVIEQNGGTGSGLGEGTDAIRHQTYDYSKVLGRYESGINETDIDPLIQEAIEKGYYNGLEGDGVTDRTVLLSMKIMKGETHKKCPHSASELKHNRIIKPKDGVITYRVHNFTEDTSEIKQQILFSNIFIWRENILKPIQFNRVYEGEADIDIRFSYPDDPNLPAPFKDSSLAYAILPLGEIRINDKRDFDVTGDKELLYVLTHEIGHLLGLGHNSMKEDVMYYSYKGDKEIKILESTKATLKARYSHYISNS